MLTKALRGLKIIDEAEGRVKAVFATFNVKDHDGDVTVPGAFEEGAPVRISAYNHASWAGALPVGKGTITSTDSEALLDGQFFMNTTHGRDTFQTVKEMGDLQEWSYGYDIEDAEPGTKDGEPVQFLKRQKVHEVSPVLLGAGIATRTVTAKAKGIGTCAECGKSTTPLFDGAGQLKALICQAADCGHIDRKQLDSDLEEELGDAGTERFGTADTYVYLYDHDVDENFAVFSLCPKDYGSAETRFVQVNFTRGADGSVQLMPDQLDVEPQTTFVPEKSKADDGAGSASDGELDATKTSDAGGGEEPPKALQDEPGRALKLIEQLNDVQERGDEALKRLRDVMTLRAEQGKSLGEQTRDRAQQLADQFEATAKTLREVVTSADADQPDENESRLTLEDETQLAELTARHGLSL